MSRALAMTLSCLSVLVSGCLLDRAGRLGDAGETFLPPPRRLDSGPRPDGGAPPRDGAPSPMDGGRTTRDAAVGPLDAASVADAAPADAVPDASCADAGIAPTSTVRARPAVEVVVDGDLTEWADAEWVAIAPPDDFVQDGSRPLAEGALDLSARLAARWSSESLWIAVEVTDDRHSNGESGHLVWRGDSIQVAFDVAGDGGADYDDTDDFEYGYALTEAGLARHRWTSPSGAPAPGDEAAVIRAGSTTRYELRLGASDLDLFAFDEGRAIGFAWIVNENDTGGTEREGYVEWTSGIGTVKRPEDFGTLLLAGPGCP